MKPGYTVLVAGLFTLASACAQLQPRPETGSMPAGAPELNWELQGRLAVYAGDEGWHASLNWRQTGDAYLVELRGPLGQGAVRLQGDASGVTLERADGLRDRATDVDDLLARHTGWVLPVSGLRYWVRGQAVPDHEALWERDAQGRPQRLQQDGWDIRYTDYLTQPELGVLPRRIDLERDGLHARLVIDAWAPATSG